MRSASRRLALLLAMSVLSWSATAAAGQLVYCVGDDGHGGFERAHGGTSWHDDCEPPLVSENGAHGERAGSCSDISLGLWARQPSTDETATTGAYFATGGQALPSTRVSARGGGECSPARPAPCMNHGTPPSASKSVLRL